MNSSSMACRMVVAVDRFPVPAEHRQRLVLRRGGEGEETQVRLPAPLGHAARQLLLVLETLLLRAFAGGLMQVFTAEHFLQIRRRLPSLRAVGLVHDDRAASSGKHAGALCSLLLGHLEQMPGHEGELLQRGDDDGDGVLQGLGQLPGPLVDLLNDPELVLELVDRVLQLLIQNDAVSHDDHAVEDALVRLVVQGSEPVGQPADGIALATAGRVLDEIVVPVPLAPSLLHQQPDRVELVVAREDHRLDLHLAAVVVASLLGLQMDEPGKHVEQAVPGEHLLPEVGRPVAAALRVGRVPGAPVTPLVEGKELGGVPGQPRGHANPLGVYGEVHERTALELEDRLPRIAVAPVLLDRILHRLPGERVLQLHRGDGDAVQTQRQVERLLRAGRETKLSRKPEPIGGVASFELGVQVMGRLEEGSAERAPVALEAVPQGGERAVGVHPLAQVGEYLLAGLGAVEGFQLGPLCGLGFADEGEDGVGEDGPVSVEAVAWDRGVSVPQQVSFDDGLEGGLRMPGGARQVTCSSVRISCAGALW